MPHTSAIPLSYWLIFGWFEPLLTIGGCIGGFLQPQELHDQQAPWPNGIRPKTPLPLATLVTILQLSHTVALLGFINFFLLWSARRHLSSQPALQEKVVAALLTPLVFGDVFHMAVTLWALGEDRWNVREWSGILWATMVFGVGLLVPRVMWHLGIGRYVHARDGKNLGKYS
ncbi:hypothetical protein BXZ70DRAFT_998421 [Cristinia sonorae]|uniref:DUF7704 domain-containing protein n=1 Tax=Cristinia sonorae TaxID=1940300 RepID=A0A8K0UV79_9AGAR|nr:hypothetical protein BXZ70DRAFT_998421 [Cristinia sonorae]